MNYRREAVGGGMPLGFSKVSRHEGGQTPTRSRMKGVDFEGGGFGHHSFG